VTFSKSPLFVSSTLFLLLLGSTLSGFGNLIIYVFFLMASVFYLLTGGSRYKIPKCLLPLAFYLFLYIVYSSFFALDIVTHVTYSSLYISCFLTTLFAFRFPQQAVFLLVCFAFALSALVLTGLFYPGSVIKFFIDNGIDPNYTGYFLVAGIFALSRFPVYNPRVSRLLILIILMAGLFLQSRSFILLIFVLGFLTFWERALSGSGKVILVILVLPVAYFFVNLLMETQYLFTALTSMVRGEVELGDLIADRRRIELFATGIRAVNEFFPFGTGMGPENYKAAVLDAGLVTSSTLRLGYPHNYFISGIAQAGFAGVIFIAYLFKIGISARKDFPVIGALLIGLAFNEYIGISVLWIYFGLYFNERFG
jgi:hypothetical protein